MSSSDLNQANMGTKDNPLVISIPKDMGIELLMTTQKVIAKIALENSNKNTPFFVLYNSMDWVMKKIKDILQTIKDHKNRIRKYIINNMQLKD